MFISFPRTTLNLHQIPVLLKVILSNFINYDSSFSSLRDKLSISLLKALCSTFTKAAPICLTYASIFIKICKMVQLVTLKKEEDKMVIVLAFEPWWRNQMSHFMIVLMEESQLQWRGIKRSNEIPLHKSQLFLINSPQPLIRSYGRSRKATKRTKLNHIHK